MNTLEIILSIISGLGTTGVAVLGYWLKRVTNKRLAIAEADKAEADVNKEEWNLEKERLAETHETLMTLNGIIRSQGETVANLNKALDEKTQRIRDLTDANIIAEHEINRVNMLLVDAQAEIGDLKAEIGELKLRQEHYREWRCYRHDCGDERGRKPKQEREHTEDGKDIE